MILKKEVCIGEIDYSIIDKGIVDLVRRLNQIDFISTLTSSEGHVRDNYRKLVADSGFCFLYPSYLELEIFEHERSSEFIDLLKELESRNSFVYLDYDIDWDKSNEGVYSIDFDLEYNVLDQVDREFGIGRIRDYKKFWEELIEVSNRFPK